MYPKLPFYRRMLIDAGYPEASEAAWSDAMIDGLIVHGDETKAAEGLKTVMSIGASEILVSPILAGSDPAASMERTVKLLGQVAKASG